MPEWNNRIVEQLESHSSENRTFLRQLRGTVVCPFLSAVAMVSCQENVKTATFLRFLAGEYDVRKWCVAIVGICDCTSSVLHQP